MNMRGDRVLRNLTGSTSAKMVIRDETAWRCIRTSRMVVGTANASMPARAHIAGN